MKEQVQLIRVEALRPFRDHPFRVKDDEAMQALCNSIREYGSCRRCWPDRQGRGMS